MIAMELFAARFWQQRRCRHRQGMTLKLHAHIMFNLNRISRRARGHFE